MLTLSGEIISSKLCIVQTCDEIHSEIVNFKILSSEIPRQPNIALDLRFCQVNKIEINDCIRLEETQSNS